MKETWKDVIGYEGYYMVSSKGKIKSNCLTGRSKTVYGYKWKYL